MVRKTLTLGAYPSRKVLFYEVPDLTVEVIMMGISSISLSWSVAGDTVVDSEVVW